MSSKHEDYADRVIAQAMMTVNGGLDIEAAAQAVNHAVAALKDQAIAMAAKAKKLSEDDEASVLIISKAMTNTARVIDDVTRLIAFADKGGRDDSNQYAAQLLAFLTDEELAMIQARAEANAKR